jgi:hypothetical protein
MVANKGPVHAAAERVSARNSDGNGEGLMRSGCVKGRRALPPPDGTNLPKVPRAPCIPARLPQGTPEMWYWKSGIPLS